MYTHIKVRVQKPYPIYDQNGEISLNWYPIYDQNSRKTIPFWARTYLYNPYKGVSPPPVKTTAILRICVHAPAITHIKILSAAHAQTKCPYAQWKYHKMWRSITIF